MVIDGGERTFSPDSWVMMSLLRSLLAMSMGVNPSMLRTLMRQSELISSCTVEVRPFLTASWRAVFPAYKLRKRMLNVDIMEVHNVIILVENFELYLVRVLMTVMYCTILVDCVM